jgi:protein-tyrosine sulfotransferase
MIQSDFNQSFYSELIVLCGPPRSGTTWLCRELCNAPTAFPFLPECTFLTQQIDLYHRTSHYCDRQRVEAYFASKKNMLDYFRANVAKLIDQVARLNAKVDARTLVLKDPGICFYLMDLKDLLPPHKLVVLVRDPRDVLASMKNVMAKKQQKWDMTASMEELLNYYYQIGNHYQRAEKNCIFVRYEDLVVGQFAALRGFLNLALEMGETSGDKITNVRERLDSSDPFFSELCLQPTTATKVGSYVKTLTRKEIRHIEIVCAAIIRQWGYPLAPSVRSIISSLIRNRQPAKVPE